MLRNANATKTSQTCRLLPLAEVICIIEEPGPRPIDVPAYTVILYSVKALSDVIENIVAVTFVTVVVWTSIHSILQKQGYLFGLFFVLASSAGQFCWACFKKRHFTYERCNWYNKHITPPRGLLQDAR